MPSPFDPGAERLKEALAETGVVDIASAAAPVFAVALLPAVGGVPIASSPLIAEPPPASGTSALERFAVTALPFDPLRAEGLLWCAAERELLAPGVVAGTTLRYWSEAFRLATRLILRQRFLPGIGGDAGQFHARWEPVITGEEARWLERLAGTMPGACRALLLDDDAVPAPSSRFLLARFLSTVVDALVRSWSPPPLRTLPPARPGRRRVRPRARAAADSFDSLHDQWLDALRTPDGAIGGVTAELGTLAEAIAEWRRPLRVVTDSPFRLCFRLEEPGKVQGSAASDAWFVRYLLRPESDPSLLLPLGDIWKPRSRGASLSKHSAAAAREYLLAALGQASKLSAEIDRSLRDIAPEGYRLDVFGAHAFLNETAWLLEQSGFVVLLPAWWTRKGTRQRLTARAVVSTPKLRASAGLSLDTIVQVDWQIALGDHPLTGRELEMLARLKAPLVNLRGEWVQLDAREIEQALRFWKKQKREGRSVEEVVRMALGAARTPDGLDVAAVDLSGALRDLLDRLEGTRPLDPVAVPESFCGTLRPYQEHGYRWLEFMSGFGLGACLADDMGLGKTVQTLALLELDYRSGHGLPTLLVCPTSVTENWRKEAERFTPGLPVMVHHGSSRAKGKQFAKAAARNALVVTSYALLQRDIDTLRQIEWSGVVLDEAQNIKNPQTRQAQAARALDAGYRIALTGTPIENHVGDLWSIMEFLNPGLLGPQATFRRRFLMPIQVERDPEASESLRRLTAPFILRRLKTDTAVIADLPEKQEMKVFCTLTPEQASLYAAVVHEATGVIDTLQGIERKGVVLATITKLKQVCNHPAHFLGDNSPIPGRSGKLARVTEMLEEALSAGDRALIFTQYAAMGEILKRHLQESFGVETLFLHGGTPKKQRDRMVERFQDARDAPPIFVLSLKAGGTGLNLTAASHVFHFDRWWNPAVENQATDRAFRIGQRRNVQVHKFLCAGTFEERIDEMIERKKEIAERIVGSGEGWLTELSTAELKKLFELRESSVDE